MSKIGLDIDGVLTDIEHYQLKKGTAFFKKKYHQEIQNPEGFDIKKIFNCSEKQYRRFWTKYLIPYSLWEKARPRISEEIKRIHDNKDSVNIITSREFACSKGIAGHLMRAAVRSWLKRNHIVYDTITYCKGSKLKIINDLKIDIMIEDNPDNCLEIAEVIDVICIAAKYNQTCSHVNIFKLDDVTRLYDTVELIKKKPGNLYLQNRSFTNHGSIDQPWLQFYTQSQFNVQIPQQTIYQYMYQCSKDYPEMQAIGYFGKSMSYREFFHRIDQYAKAFLAYGVKSGDIVTVCMPNAPEGVISFYAINKIGAVADMVHPLSSKDEIGEYLHNSKSKIMIMIDLCYEKVKELLPTVSLEQVIVVSAGDSMPLIMRTGYQMLNAGKLGYYHEKHPSQFIKCSDFLSSADEIADLKEADFVPDKLSVLLHTGGSTGKAKAVMLTNENFNTNVEQLKTSIPHYVRGQHLLAITPIFHGFGLADCVHTSLCSNSKVVLMPQYNEKLFAKTFVKEKITFLIGVPTLFASMVSSRYFKHVNLSLLTVPVSGGITFQLIWNVKSIIFLRSTTVHISYIRAWE
ncbi:MAG: AMP-binding protein [bacterium]|nr:AMP-binding protein [bacterium]